MTVAFGQYLHLVHRDNNVFQFRCMSKIFFKIFINDVKKKLEYILYINFPFFLVNSTYFLRIQITNKLNDEE